MNLKQLEKLGMTAREVKIYVKLLELGSTTANALAKRLDENRTSVYSLLQSLQKKGFVSYAMQRGVKRFVPTDPHILIGGYLEGAQNLKLLLPQIGALYNATENKPKITFYEGVSGIKQLCEILLEVPGSTRLSFMGVDQKTIHPEIKHYFENDFIGRRIQLGIKFKAIVTGEVPFSSKHEKDHEKQLREMRRIDPKQFPMNIQIDIFPQNKVAIYSYNKNEMMGVLIEHASFYNTMHTVFELAWCGAGNKN